MKSFIDKVKNNNYWCIGFDLDGTLYDEFDFVRQAYISVSHVMADRLRVDNSLIFEELCTEWLIYGSSANIFQRVVSKHSELIDPEFIKLCVDQYRVADFSIELSSRASVTLDYLSKHNYGLFIVTDGNANLQRRKIKELQLTKWFAPENIVISGDYGRDMQKPNAFMASQLNIINHHTQGVLYVGDRICDHDFAGNCGFDFCYLRNMNLG